MKTPDELWNDLGEVAEEEIIHVVTKLFMTYEDQIKKDPHNLEAIHFFKNLANSIEQTTQCNLNRR